MTNTTNHASTTAGLAFAVVATALATAPGAHAVPVSTAPAGFTAVTVGGGGVESYSFDLDANGTNDFTIFGAEGLFLSPISSTSAASSFENTVRSFANTSGFTIGSVKALGNIIALGSVSVPATTPGGYVIPTDFGTSQFAAAAVDATFDRFGIGISGTLGYIQGTVTPEQGAVGQSFTLLDFGLIQDAPVPEPASLALLAAGAAGIAALRRRKPAAA